jgi:hypothetical protein
MLVYQGFVLTETVSIYTKGKFRRKKKTGKGDT